ncbi:unnamed protein product [Calypogeia fissa]
MKSTVNSPCAPRPKHIPGARRHQTEDAPETVFYDQFVRPKGYLCKEHKIYTEDGFKLLLHRVGIPGRREGGGDEKQGDIQSNLKVALSQRRRKNKSVSRSTSEMKRGDSKAGITDNVVDSQRAQPFQPFDTTHSESRSSDQQQGPRRAHRPRSIDARDLPENLPISLPPLSVEYPAITIDPKWLSAQPLETLEKELIPTTLAGYPYTSFGPLPEVPFQWSEHGETQQLSPEPRIASRFCTPLTPGPSRLDSPGQLPEPRDQPPPVPAPAVSDPTTTSATAPSLPELPPDSAFPEPSGPEGQEPGDIPEGATPPSSPVQRAEPPSGPEGVERCGPVLLLHHELLNGDMWFTEVNGNAPSPLLPFRLADNGFDVWVGHERATYWSHNHIRLDTSELDYWNWSWDEFVDHDLPIMLNHIQANTNSKVHVVGVSRSAAVALAASTQQAVASLMKSLVLVGPSIYHGSEGLQQVQTWAQLFHRVINMTRPDDPSLFSGQFNISRNFGMHNWSLGGPASLITGPDCCISTPLSLFQNGWDGTTSYKNFQHFEQSILTNTFQRFDYGSASGNLDAYGQPKPPAYSPADVPVDLPLQVIYAGNDFFCPQEGVEELFPTMQKMQKLPMKVYLRLYAHFDLLYSSSRHQDVYFPILSFLRDSARAP